MQDIANLANVRRPVVSMWRQRPMVRGVEMPFPEPVGVVDGVERFDHRAVVDWLERTGRGNNADLALDVAALAVPDGANVDDVVTLLCWSALVGEDLAGTTRADRAVGAALYDPEDALLRREISGQDVDEAVLAFVDDLIAGSFGLPDALARLDRSRLVRDLGARDLTDEALDLVRCVLGACAVHLGGDAALVCDGSAALYAGTDFSSIVIHDEVVDDRALRRRATIMGLPISDAVANKKVSLSTLLGLTPAEALDRADRAMLDLGPGDVAVILGPASALCDDLTGPLQQGRSETLRVANLVAAMRLPRGMWREAHRQSLGLWVCVGGATVERPLVADLDASEVVLEDLAFDIAGALAQSAERAYRYARWRDLRTVVIGGAVVPRGVRALRFRGEDAQTHLDRVHRATLTTTTALSPIDVMVAPSLGGYRFQQRSLGELQQTGLLALKRGSRINTAHASAEGTVHVLPDRNFAFDPFDAAEKYPRANRTEPGDVVFVERPRPRAVVDLVGGSLVASPARILRPERETGPGPYLLATVINAMLPGTEWQTWSVPALPREEASRLEAALEEADRYERDVRARGDAVRELRTALIDGVAAGALTLDVQPTTPGVAAVHT